MNTEQAKRILNVSEYDDKAEIKRKYRRLMSTCHPDAAGSEEPEQIRRAQEINAAYSVLKKEIRISTAKKEKKEKAWQGEVNEKAFCDRNIYQYYSMEISKEHLYYQAARGKFLWNPDEEEFELFLISVRHAAKELLDRTEEGICEPWEETATVEAERFRFQAQVFQSLSMQFIHPAATLRKIAEPVSTDRMGREVYRFRAFLGAKGQKKTIQALAGLKEGDVLYPASFQGNKIAVRNKEKETLGHLSLEDDRLYFCVIPLLKRRLAQVKMTVREVDINRRTGPYKAKVEVAFFFRMEKEADGYANGSQSPEIADILRKYAEFLRGAEK